MYKNWKDGDRFFAKIPTIFLELHHFNFSHGAYQSPSQQFLGRNEIRSRLRAIFGNSDNNSGTYLITGDRGVGKTSLVNKVLEELSSNVRIPKSLERYFFLLLGIFFINFLLLKMPDMDSYNLFFNYEQLTQYKTVVLWGLVFIFLFSLFYLAYYSLLKNVRKEKFKCKFKCKCKFRYKLNFIFNFILNSIFSFFYDFSNGIIEYLTWGRDKSWSNRLFNVIKAVGAISVFLFLYLKWNINPFVSCVWFGGALCFVSLVRGLNKMLYRTNNKYSKDFRKSIGREEKKSYKFSFFVCSFAVLIPLIVYYVFLQSNLVILIVLLGILVYLVWGICRFSKSTWSLFFRIIIENLKKHYTIRHLFNTPKKIFVKINLGYEELKSIDVLRLISHNITLEYQKYLYATSFYFWRTFVVVVICFIITKFFHENGYLNYYFELRSWNIVNQYIVDTYEWICLGISYILTFIYKVITINSSIDISGSSNYVFEVFDFRQFVFFISLVLLYKLSAYIPFIKFLRAPFCNLNKLKTLQDSIGASIKREESVSSNNNNRFFSFFGISRKIEKNYPMSDAHDIEKKLISIIDDISHSWLFRAPQFIIIFDELDKIESPDVPAERTVKTDSFSPDTIRNRQEAVFKLLSSLKYILTTMNAKFIFVAGREIYEASLADAADRSHYLSSIFNDVIYVPSFMSDFSDGKSSDICSMTEQYVCRQLMPEGINADEFSLRTYYKYLTDKDKETGKDGDGESCELERQKIIFTLHNFIVYLTYASKGAPKKMINLFENYVKRQQAYAYDLAMKVYAEQSVMPITRKYSRNTLFYLKFDFYEQYAINIMARMVHPIIYRFNRSNIHQHGDKLIVSTFFALDHLYKFHRYSFSWRALESSPELIDVDKIPELRNHITDLLHFLSQNDLKIIRNGLYDFRFFKKISQEICFLTRVSEHASAIFNFTLDESLAVKQFYRRKLDLMRKQYEADRITNENAVDGLASVHFALGELSLYDEDIGDAIMEFDSALSILETVAPQSMTLEQIIVLIKTMLSLGIAYEKQNLNDRALLIYSEAVRILVASRNTDISNFGLDPTEVEGHIVFSPDVSSCRNREPQIYFRNSRRQRPLMDLLDSLSHLHPDIHNIISKITAYESLRLLYLPLLAKFQMLEKSQLGGIQKMDIKRVLKEFNFLANMLNKDNKNMMYSTFYLKVGNILYYKNSHFIANYKDFTRLFPNAELLRNANLDLGETTDALFFYTYSLVLLLPERHFLRLLLFKKNSPCRNDLFYLIESMDNNFEGWDDSKFNLLATIFTKIGDTLLSVLKDSQCKSCYSLLEKYVDARRKHEKNDYEAICDAKDKISEKLSPIIVCYILSLWFYKKGTSYNMASSQCLKILSLIRYHFKHCNGDNIISLAEYFLNQAINNTRNAFKDMYFENEQDICSILKRNDDQENNSLLKSRHILYDEVFESVVAYEDIRLRRIISEPINSGSDSKKEISDFYDFFNTIHYENITNIYNRLKLLKFKSEVNYVWFQALCENNLDYSNIYALELGGINNTDVPNDIDKTNAPRLIADSIFNLMEVLKFTKIYGETYLLTNLFVADTSQKLMYWLRVKQDIARKNSSMNGQIDNFLKRLLGEGFQDEIQKVSQWANAHRFYYKVKEMHSQGRTYKDMISRTCFLTDEYSDQRFHFITARERRVAEEVDFREHRRNVNCGEEEDYFFHKILGHSMDDE